VVENITRVSAAAHADGQETFTNPCTNHDITKRILEIMPNLSELKVGDTVEFRNGKRGLVEHVIKDGGYYKVTCDRDYNGVRAGWYYKPDGEFSGGGPYSEGNIAIIIPQITREVNASVLPPGFTAWVSAGSLSRPYELNADDRVDIICRSGEVLKGWRARDVNWGECGGGTVVGYKKRVGAYDVYTNAYVGILGSSLDPFDWKEVSYKTLHDSESKVKSTKAVAKDSKLLLLCKP